MEKLKAFFFYHGEKVGLAVVVVLCLLGLWAARPWAAAGAQDSGLKRDLGTLDARVKGAAPQAGEFAHPDLVAQLQRELSAPQDVRAFSAATWAFGPDIAVLPEDRQNYLRLAPVAQVQVVPERGGLKVTWTSDPQKQVVENAQARYEGIIELMQAVIYRATAEAPTQLQQVGTVPLEDVVIIPSALGPTGRPAPQRFVLGSLPSRPQPEAALLTVPPGKVAAADAEQAGRFAYADRAVKADQDYVYKVALVAKNPRYDPANPGGAPELIESELPSTVLSLAQRPLPSIRWFFMGGNTERASVRVYKWHVFSVAASEAAAAGSPATPAAAPAVTQPGLAAAPAAGAVPPGGAAAASAAATVERGQWVVENFSVSPGDPIGRQVAGYFSAGAMDKPEQLTIDFSTGCTAVAVDMVLRITDNPQVTLTAAGSGRRVKDSLLLYYMDPTGALRTRWQEPDLVLAEMLAAPAATAGPAVAGTPAPAAAASAPAGRMTPQEYDRRMREYMRQDAERVRAVQAAVQRDTQAEQALRKQRESQQYVPEEGPPGF